MVFVITGKNQIEVKEKADNIVYSIEKQGRFDYFLDVRETSQGVWKGVLQIYFHKDGYPSDYKKPEVIPTHPHPHPHPEIKRG